jgi:DnaJ-class molecular chaperone
MTSDSRSVPRLNCPRCGGWGEWIEMPGRQVTCDLCNGSGRVLEALCAKAGS